MQVMPYTGRWVSELVGHRLPLRRLHGNVMAGVVLLHELTSMARTRVAVAGYYQGLISVRLGGMRADTRHYVANVMALKAAMDRGHYPR